MHRTLELSPSPYNNSPLKVTTRYALVAAGGIILLSSACNNPATTPTSPTSPTTPVTVAEPTVTEEFTGTIAVGGSSFYSFTTTLNGTITVTLTSVSGSGVPGTVWLGLGIGVPSGEDCAASTVVNTAAGTTAQVTGTYPPSVYCARVSDIGNLFAPATFTVAIAHPE